MQLTITLLDLVRLHPHATDVLDRHNLDYYCQGSRLFTDACERQNIDPWRVWQEIENDVNVSRCINFPFQHGSPQLIMDMLLHHYCDFIRRIPHIQLLLVSALDECRYHERYTVKQILLRFNELADAVAVHSALEEKVLFNKEDSILARDCRVEPLRLLEHEHIDIGSMVVDLRYATGNYSVDHVELPPDNVPLIVLRNFDRELTQRLHLENNFLFPRLKNGNA